MVLEFSILVTRMSVAPMAVSSSMAFETFLRNTMAETATQPLASRLLTVGARLPGVILEACSRLLRSTLYVQRTYF